MILILFLYLKLCILQLCVSDPGYECIEDDSNYKPEIFLAIDDKYFFDVDTFYQSKLSWKFKELCGYYYNVTRMSLKDAEKHDNVIHFAVPDYYDGKPLNNYVYAGNISKADNAVCTKTNKSQPEFDCNEIVNLVSKSLLELNDGHVYKFVQEMNVYDEPFKITNSESCRPFDHNTLDLMKVVLCLPKPYFRKQVNIHPLTLVQVPHYNCPLYLNSITTPWESDWNSNRVLAVLAPQPFEVPSENSVPTIFYETPYLFSENKTSFPNSMNLVPWRLLKYGFLKFIQAMGWQRVAIVTDDSEHSLDFELELTALFNKEKIAYTAIRCEDANCEMDKVVQELIRVSARIVIANVEEKHVQFLFQNGNYQITWLLRDVVEEKFDKYLDYEQVALSVSFKMETFTKGCGVEDNILTGLISIAQAYKNIAEEDYKVKKHEFYRRFADNMKQLTRTNTEATIVVYKLDGLKEISTMSVNATGAKLITFWKTFISAKPITDGTAHCLVTSYDYHKPCEDHLVLILVLTLMLFMITYLLITHYFAKTAPCIDMRYQNF